ncbi:glycosyltransferase family 2 protein, partial [Candidatus Margulisiibacteriota bacterium]
SNDVVVDPEFLTELVRAAESDPKIGIVGPKIYYYGKDNVIWAAGDKEEKVFKRFVHIGGGKKDRGQFSKQKDVDIMSACAALIKKEVIQDVGYLNDDYFRTAEDIEYCIRAKKAGYRIIFVPSSKIWHKGSAATGGEKSPQNEYYGLRNILYLVKMYHRKSLSYVLLKYYIKYVFLLIIGPRKRAEAVLDAILDFKNDKQGKSSKY